MHGWKMRMEGSKRSSDCFCGLLFDFWSNDPTHSPRLNVRRGATLGNLNAHRPMPGPASGSRSDAHAPEDGQLNPSLPASRAVELTPRVWRTMFADDPLRSDRARARDPPVRIVGRKN